MDADCLRLAGRADYMALAAGGLRLAGGRANVGWLLNIGYWWTKTV